MAHAAGAPSLYSTPQEWHGARPSSGTTSRGACQDTDGQVTTARDADDLHVGNCPANLDTHQPAFVIGPTGVVGDLLGYDELIAVGLRQLLEPAGDIDRIADDGDVERSAAVSVIP